MMGHWKEKPTFARHRVRVSVVQIHRTRHLKAAVSRASKALCVNQTLPSPSVMLQAWFLHNQT